MAAVHINETALVMLGVALQANIPGFSNLSITELTNTTTFTFLMEAMNRHTGNASYDKLHGLYVSAFGNETRPADVHQIMLRDMPHKNRCPMETRVTVSMVSLSTIVIAFRFYSRWMLLGKIRWDDIFILIALGFVWASQTFQILSCTYAGAGQHIWDITYEQLKPNLFYAYMIYLMFIPALMFFIKLSFLHFYSLLSTERKFRLTCKIVALLFTGVTIMDFFAHMFSCNWKYWNDPLNRKCVDLLALDRSCGSLHIVTDFIILCLPFFVITPSTLRPREKLGLISFFALGFLVCVATLMRVLSLTNFHQSPDIPFVQVNTAIWASTEANLAMIVSCFPALKQLLLYYSKHSNWGKSIPSTGSIINVLVNHRGKTPSHDGTKDLEAGRGGLKHGGTFGSKGGGSKVQTVMIELPKTSLGSRIASKLSSFASAVSSTTRTWIGATTHAVSNDNTNGTSRTGNTMGSESSTDWVMTQMEVEDVERRAMGGGLRPPPAPHRRARTPPPADSSWLNLCTYDEERDVSLVAKDLYGDTGSSIHHEGE